MTKTIFKYVNIALIVTSIVLIIITLVNYYSYTNALFTIQSGNLTEIAKFELQDSKNLYLYRTLRLIPWTSFVSLITSVVSGVTLYLHLNKKKIYNKTR